MNKEKVITNVVGGLLLIAIVFIYTSISKLTDQIHGLELKFTAEIGLLRAELTQYHTLVGIQQRDIEKLEIKVEKLH